MNHTYKVNYIRDDGSGMAKIKSYLVQRVNTYAFQRPLELMSNIDKVTEYILSLIHILSTSATSIATTSTARRSSWMPGAPTATSCSTSRA